MQLAERSARRKPDNSSQPAAPRPPLIPTPSTARHRRHLSGNRWQGSLPEAWAAPGAFPRLQSLSISSAHLNGSLPASWGRAGAWPALKDLLLDDNNLRGPLPLEWGAEGAYPSLERL